MIVAFKVFNILFFLYALYKVTTIFYTSVWWRIHRRSDVKLATELKNNSQPLYHLTDSQLNLLARLLKREGIYEKKRFDKQLLSAEVYCIENADITKKDWLKSNSELCVAHKVNGFELFIPGRFKFIEMPEPIKEIRVVFYGHIAVLVEAPGLFDIYQEEEEALPYEPYVRVTKTPVALWHDVSAQDARFNIKGAGEGWITEPLGNSGLLVYRRNPVIEGILFVTAVSGGLSALVAGIACIAAGDALGLPSFFFLWAAIWFLLVLLFCVYEVRLVNREPVILADRHTKSLRIFDTENVCSELKWDEIWLRFQNESGWPVGGMMEVLNAAHIHIYRGDVMIEPIISMRVPYYQSSFAVWNSISGFMQNDFQGEDGTFEIGNDGSRKSVLVSGCRRFVGHVKNNYLSKGLAAQFGWALVTFVTMGPFPFLVAELIARLRFRRASRSCMDLS
ncbi:hypothetical protein [uncultured Marinobacter sp.]|uniref:hypothetical protein n=1 Tax=uncultured Marinobacter sp. TaxID=187379 RepID=UPI00261F9184|nr:hypothetical protein [uncultured Marinobacter sp.]